MTSSLEAVVSIAAVGLLGFEAGIVLVWLPREHVTYTSEIAVGIGEVGLLEPDVAA